MYACVYFLCMYYICVYVCMYVYVCVYAYIIMCVHAYIIYIHMSGGFVQREMSYLKSGELSRRECPTLICTLTGQFQAWIRKECDTNGLYYQTVSLNCN